MKKIYIYFVLLGLFFVPTQSFAATLSLSAPLSTYKVNDTFNVTVNLSALSSEQVVAVDIPALTFDASKLQIQGTQVTVISSALGPVNKASTTINTVNNTTGTATFGMQYWADIANNPSFLNSTAAIATISFKVIASGSASISTGAQAIVASYSGTNVLTGSTPLTLTLNSVVTDTTPPTVSVTSPASGATVSGSTVTLSASASDNVAVAGVQFKVDGVNVGVEDTTAPYSVSWNTTGLVDNSSHTVTAVARDTAGLTTTATGVVVYVNNTTSNKFIVGDRIQANTGGFNVRSTPNGTSLGTQTVNTLGTVISDTTYSSPTSAGGYVWWKVNFDTGFDGWAAEQFLTKYVPPAFNFSLTNGGSKSVTQGQSVTNSVTATLTSGSAQSVSFSATAPSGVTASISPTSCTPNTTCMVTVTLTAASGAPVTTGTVTVTATDGSVTQSTTFSLTVNAPAADTTKPTVAITAPASGANVSGSAVTLSANASDIGVGGGAGTVTKVEFFIDGVKVGEDITATAGGYSIVWDSFSGANGTKTLLVTATDAAGLTQNDSRNITVANVLSTKFVVGDQVQVNANGVNIRATAGTSGSSNGTHNTGDIGSVVSGPTYANNYWWWNLSFAVGFGGWMAEDYLDKYVPPVPVFDFSLATEGAKTVAPGSSVTEMVTVAKVGTATSLPVTFSGSSLSGLPTGVTASVSSTSCTPNTTCTVTFTINVPAGTAAVSAKTITVSGVNGTLTRTATFPLTITAPASFNFTLTAGSPLSVARTGSVTTTFGTTLSSGTGQVITFSASNLPSGVSASFSPASCTPTCSTTLTLSATSLATLVTSQSVTITATGGGVTQTATLPLSVTAQPDSQAPTAPGAVTATAPAYNQVNLSWTASTDDVGVVGYRVYKDGVVLPQTTTLTTYQVTGLSANTTYRFQVEAYDQSGKATRSPEQSITTPSAPDTVNPTVSITGLTAGQNVSGTVTLTASASDNVGVKGVQFAVAGQSLGAQDTTSPYSVSWNTTNVANGTTVQITATAYDVAGNSAVATLSVKVNNVVADTTGPQISSISESGITTTGAISSFSTDEPATYAVRYSVAGTGLLYFVSDVATYRTSHQAIISGLLPNTNYQYDIIVFDQAGNQTQSSVRSFKTTALVVPDTTPPPPISSLQVVSKSPRAVTVSWVAPLDTGGSENSGKVASYSLAYAGFSLSDSNWANARFAGGLPSPANPGVTQSYTVVDLSPNTTYSFAIKSKDAAGLESSISNVVSVTTSVENTPPSTGGTSGGGGGGGVVDNTPPGKVNKLKVKEFDSQVSLSWENPTNTDFVRTVVVRKEATAPASRADGTKVYEGTGIGFNDLNLENNKEYFYALYTVDSSSNYSDAEIISAKPRAGTTQATEVATTGNNPVPPGTGSTSSGALPPVTGPFSVGMTSEQVKVLQTILAQDSTIYPEGKVTGYYGPATVLAVQRFQEKYMGITGGSPTTNGYGLAGQTTRAKINEVFSLTASSGSTGTTGNTNPPPVTTGSVTEKVVGPFSVGMTSEQVKVLQTILAQDSTIYPEGKVTGYYGPATVLAVQRFQEKYMGITGGSPTTNGYGLAGQTTRAKINEVFGTTNQTALTPEQTAALIEDLKRQIAELTKKINELIQAKLNSQTN